MHKLRLITTTSAAAICCIVGVSPVSAQDQSSGDAAIESIVVSASHISLGGYEQPTPVTVIDSAQLDRDAKPNLADLFAQMPQFGVQISAGSQQGSQSVSAGGAGASNLNLRNVGTNRTLVLVNGSRVVTGDLNQPAVDINMIPDIMIKRIDIVTGGASAIWGSDAVSGVVNFVMDNNYTGFKTNIEASDDQWDIRQQGRFQAAWGMPFLGDRGHFVLGMSYWVAPQNPLISQVPYSNYGALMNNPAYTPTNGQPQLINIRGGYASNNNLGLSAFTSGGLINSGPLKGIQFVGPTGTPTPFNFGNVSGPLSYGGTAQSEAQAGEDDALASPIRNLAFYGNASYNLFGNVKANLELELTGTSVSNTSLTVPSVDTISINNAYLQAYPQIIAQMVADNVTSFPLGTENINDVQPFQENVNTRANNSVGLAKEHSHRQMERGTFSLSGSNDVLGTDWEWSATFQQSVNHRHAVFDNIPITANIANAVNAVYVTAANVGNSGLPIGSIACASTLTNPTNGCQPLDVLGDGVASQAAINYVSPGPGSGLQQYQLLELGQETANVTIQGQPFSLWAGPVAAAFGWDYRMETANQTANALSYAAAYGAGNFPQFHAHYFTQEGFAEINAPLLRDTVVQSLEFDGAGRITSYSTSGLVETWKMGLVSQVNDDLRMRASWSTDIRAPGLLELFNPGTTGSNQNIPGQTQLAFFHTGGNPNLKPEVGINIEAGVVLTPRWIPGLTSSVDYWSINIHGAVINPTATQILAQCSAGQLVYCGALQGYPGIITQVNTQPLNAASLTESGADFQTDYVQGIFDGNMHVGFQASYVDHQTTSSSLGTTDIANSLNGDTGGSGAPKFRATLSATYDEGLWSATVQSRIVGAGAYNNLLQVGIGPTTFTGTPPGLGTVANNYVPPVAYLDLRASYRIGDHFQVYGAIDNAMDIPPPYIPATANETFGAYLPAFNSNFYDTFGRVFRVGLRLSY